MAHGETQHDLGECIMPPTPLRRAEARRAGQVARSSDASGVAVLLVGVGLLVWLGPTLLSQTRAMTAALLDGRSAPLADPTSLATAAWLAGRGLLLSVAALIGGVVLAAVVAGLVQVGPLLTAEPLRPRMERISPVAGLRRLFRGESAIYGFMTLVKLAAATVVIYTGLRTHWQALFVAWDGTISQWLAAMGGMVRPIVLQLLAVLGGLAIVDVLYQRWRLNESLKTTRQQWKDDLKRSEGDPQIRHRRRRRALEQSGRATLAVCRANVVLTAPQLAVALKYDETMTSPRVVAKGKREDAERIVHAAKQSGVMVFTRPKLTRQLMRYRIGQGVGRRFFASVADVIARSTSAGKGHDHA